MRNASHVDARPVPAARHEDVLALGLVPIAVIMLAVAAATILGALGFEHIGGYLPCALCLMQRVPYYVGIPVAATAALAAWWGAPRWVLVLLFGAFAALMLYNVGLASYHSGVEWGWWEGPASCAPSVGVSGVGDMLNQLTGTRPPSCTEATWRYLGLSFAGWNVLVSALLTALGAAGAVRAARVA
jgi:disulfide bond formation protein DsbB